MRYIVGVLNLRDECVCGAAPWVGALRALGKAARAPWGGRRAPLKKCALRAR